MSVADRVIVLNFGQKIADGAPSDVIADPEVRRVYMGLRHDPPYLGRSRREWGLRRFPGLVLHRLRGCARRGRCPDRRQQRRPVHLAQHCPGLLPVREGSVAFDGEDISNVALHKLVRKGLALVPEGRRLFAGMSVEDNLLVALDRASMPVAHGAGWTVEIIRAVPDSGREATFTCRAAFRGTAATWWRLGGRS